MDNKKRVEILREIQQRAKEGDFDTADFISPKLDIGSKALSARDLMEEALSDAVLKDTKFKIPGKGSTKSEVTSFLEKIISDKYPEINPDITIKEQLEALGLYDPSSKKIDLLADEVKKSPQKAVAAGLHEAAHQYDDFFLPGTGGGSRVIDLKSPELKEKNKKLGLALDPTEAYEIAGKDHHLPLSDSRRGKSFGRGALESYLKSGKFRAMLPGVLTAGAAALAGSADEALADTVIPGGVESLGKDSDKLLTDSQERDVELVRDTTKEDTLKQTRLKALQRMLEK